MKGTLSNSRNNLTGGAGATATIVQSSAECTYEMYLIYERPTMPVIAQMTVGRQTGWRRLSPSVQQVRCLAPATFCFCTCPGTTGSRFPRLCHYRLCVLFSFINLASSRPSTTGFLFESLLVSLLVTASSHFFSSISSSPIGLGSPGDRHHYVRAPLVPFRAICFIRSGHCFWFSVLYNI